jgi:Ca-activated chloride channel family protein
VGRAAKGELRGETSAFPVVMAVAQRLAGLVMVMALLAGGCGDSAADGENDSGSNYFYHSDSGFAGDGSYFPPSNNNNAPDPSPIAPQDPIEPDFCEDATDVPVTLYMSADDSGSQAQPVFARRMIELGREGSIKGLPPREYEYLNYYTFDYPAAPAGDLAIVPELRFHADPGEYSLLVGVVSPAVALGARRSWNIVFSLDSSGSMSGIPFESAKHVMYALAAQMQAGDIVSIVSWASSQNIALQAHPVSGANDPTLLAVIDGLGFGGSTDLHGGLVEAYALASQHYASDRLNRVILISDGGANTGVTDEDLIGAEAARSEGDGIFLVGIGTGDNYNHTLMDTVTDLGRGAYLYVSDEAEAWKVFGPDRVLANVEVAALGVRLELTLPPQFVIKAFHGEEISTEPSEVREQHLAPNDQMLYHTTLVYCGSGDPEAESLAFRVTWRDPFTQEALSAELTFPVGDLLLAQAGHLEKAEILVDYARLLVNADTLDASDWGAARQDLLNRIQAYTAATADPEMPEISTTLTTCAY